MSKILDKATSHFREKLSAEMQSVVVPEWDAKIYFKASVTLKEQSKLIELATQGKTVEALVETLIVKARNEDGTRMFAMPDKVTFMNEVDPNVIIRVVGEINELSYQEQDLEKVEKN
jgi:cytidylate kinase